MQYPQIQFYKGSLVRLASGELKQVEDLSSDDFLESARLVSNSLASPQSPGSSSTQSSHQQHQFNYIISNKHSQQQQVNSQPARSGGVHLDENNNSVFNSPEPTSSHFDSPTMETEEDEDEDIDVELDVVNNFSTTTTASEQLIRLNSDSQNRAMQPVDETRHSPMSTNSNSNSNNNININNNLQDEHEPEDFYIDSSVVRDFHEFGPLPSTSPTSSTCSLNPDLTSMPSTSTSTSSSSSTTSSSSSLVMSSPVANLTTTTTNTTQTVLIKFFLETSRSVAFIEVPIEHPFFVFHRGWSSWNPQRTYDKFGLKCRKLKIGDTCISLIRRQRKQQHQQHQNNQQDSDQCNILFSSIKIH